MININWITTKLKTAFEESFKLTEEEELNLVRSKDPYACWRSAKKHATSEAVQKELLTSRSTDVRIVLAANKVLAKSTQEALSKDWSVRVRCNLAQNPILTESLQKKLSEDEVLIVRQSLAKNPSLKLGPAIALYFDNSNAIASVLKEKNFNLYSKIAKLEQSVLQQTGTNFLSLVDINKRNNFVKRVLFNQNFENHVW